MPPIVFVGSPWLDASICVPRAAARIGVPATVNALKAYIDQNIVVGMSRDAVRISLMELAPIEVENDVGALPETSTDYMRVNICLDPRNNIELYIRYSLDGRLISKKIVPK